MGLLLLFKEFLGTIATISNDVGSGLWCTQPVVRVVPSSDVIFMHCMYVSRVLIGLRC